MGFIKTVNEEGQITLQLSFESKENTDIFFNGNDLKEAMKYFNLDLINGNFVQQNFNSITTWRANENYFTGSIIRYQGQLYKVIQDHQSSTDLNPLIAGNLFKKMFYKVEKEIPKWEKPLSKKFYKKGDVVFHNEKFWISNLEKNILEPGSMPQIWEEYIAVWENGKSYAFYQKVKLLNKVYLSLMPDNKEFPLTSRAWIIIEETKDEQEWERKASGYQENERVWYNGILYKSIMDNNFWSPEEYPDGWLSLE